MELHLDIATASAAAADAAETEAYLLTIEELGGVPGLEYKLPLPRVGPELIVAALGARGLAVGTGG